MSTRKGFTCHLCGYGSLVRSNFKGKPDGSFICRAEEPCAKRQHHAAQKALTFAERYGMPKT